MLFLDSTNLGVFPSTFPNNGSIWQSEKPKLLSGWFVRIHSLLCCPQLLARMPTEENLINSKKYSPQEKKNNFTSVGSSEAKR